jgi:hypothetical protein
VIAPPTLLIVGAEDHVVPLGQYAKPEDAARLGDFKALSEQAVRDIPRAQQVVIQECGTSHISSSRTCSWLNSWPSWPPDHFCPGGMVRLAACRPH